MTEKELKRLSRADLLEMLIAQSVELQTAREKITRMEEELSSRRIKMDQVGSIAEAALKLNGVFEAAQMACEQYMENIRMLNENQDEVWAKYKQKYDLQAAEILREAAAQCDAMKAEAEAYCLELRKTTEEKCEQMIRCLMEAGAPEAL